MNFIDKNQTLEPPADFACYRVFAAGAFLQVEYRRQFANGEDIVVIFLNDMGREVGRTTVTEYLPPPVADPIPAPVGRRYKIWNGILLILQDIQEMFQ